MSDESALSEVVVVIALGGNQGDREATLREATRAIDQLEGVRVLRASGLVETPALRPEGIDPDAPRYLNAVVLAAVSLSPHELLDALHGIEQRFGRVRENRWGDRTLDLDVIDYGGLRLDEETITLPHPRAHERAFVLAPWAQVQPDAELPDHGPVASLLAEATDTVVPYAAPPLFGGGEFGGNER